MTPRQCLTFVLGAALCATVGSTPTWAQAWPTQAVKIVVPFPAGGAVDLTARVVAAGLAQKWGQSVVVDNRPGAATLIGTDLVAKSTDGHTLLLTSAAFAINPALLPKLPYDSKAAFIPITLVVRSGLVLVTGARSPYKSIDDLLAAGKTAQGVSVASAGNGTIGHMSAELVADMTGLKLVHIPYKSTPQAQTDVISGQVQFMFDNPSTALPMIKDGRLRALAYSGKTRSKALPDIPTVADTVPGFDTVNWFGLMAPANLPPAAVARLARDTSDVLKRAEVVEHFKKEGVEVGGIAPEVFSAFLAVESSKWARIIRSRKIQPD